MKISLVFFDEKALAFDQTAITLLTPKRATKDSAGFDLVSANESPITISQGRWALIPTGVGLALPKGYEGQVRSRSGLAARHGLCVLNAPGTIDADYRGEIKVILINHGTDFVVERGMRIAQLIIAPVAMCDLEAVSILPDSERGQQGFGSSGLRVA